MKKWIAVMAAALMALGMTACGAKNEETTVTGMVASLDGTVVSLMAFDGEMQGGFEGSRPSMPGGQMPEDFTMPEGMEDFPMPDGEEFTMPEGFDPENGDRTPPEGFDPGNVGGMPDRGEMPTGEGRENFGGFKQMGEVTTVDLANARISVEIDGGKASGSMDDLVPGAFVTITLNGKGEATYVLVSASTGFGGGFTFSK